MNIYGNIVILRAIDTDDNQMLLSLINDPNTEVNLGGASFPISSSSQMKWFENYENGDKILRLAIAEKDVPTHGMGTVILSDIDRKNGTAQIHIKLAEECRGKGYGKDAVNALVKYAFKEQRLNCIYAEILSYNIPSQKLFEKCGFVRDGVLRSRVYKSGNYVDVYSYSILSSDVLSQSKGMIL